MARGLGDRRAQLRIVDRAQPRLELGRKRGGGRRGAARRIGARSRAAQRLADAKT
jgi:hypothetical protein